MRLMSQYVAGISIAILTMAVVAHAGGPVGVPEIDGMSISSGLGMLAAGVLIVRSRRRTK